MIRRLSGAGWLALLGGGEFSFGETYDADRVWLAHTAPGPVGFIPAASGSEDYGFHLADYLDEEFEREVVTIPVYRGRDGRRGKNAERIAEVAAVYLGGGVTDHLLEAIAGTPVAEALAARLRDGGVVVAIAAAAQAAGEKARSIFRGEVLAGLGWLPGGVVEPNFDPRHDRRLRQLLAAPGVGWGLGIPTGGAVLLGPEGVMEVVGEAWGVEGERGELARLAGGEDDVAPRGEIP
jgi:cyanophycinase-like exopeptidase